MSDHQDQPTKLRKAGAPNAGLARALWPVRFFQWSEERTSFLVLKQIKAFLNRDRVVLPVVVVILALSTLAALIFVSNHARVEKVSGRFDTSITDRLLNDAFRLTLAVEHDVLNPGDERGDADGIYEVLRVRIAQIEMETASIGLRRYFHHLKKSIDALKPLMKLRFDGGESVEVFENVYRVAADTLQFNTLYNDEAREAISAEQEKLEASLLAIGVIVGVAILLCALLVWRIIVQNRRLADAVGIDGLTGIGNRVGFDRHIENLPIGTVRRIILFDLDKFKSINDSLGHHAGDELLRIVAGRLTDICPRGAFPYRIGGDEFAVVLSGPDAIDAAESLCRRILTSIAVPVRIGGKTLSISTSLGVSDLYANADTDISSLMRQADKALYAAKDAGRGRFRVYGPDLVTKTSRADRLQFDLAHAIASGQIFVVYHPMICLRTGRTLGFESLVRWDHPELGEIASSEFVAIAETSGTIADLGRFVLEETCRTAVAWPERYRVSMNVSPSELTDPRFAELAADTLARFGLSPTRFEFEIAEALLSGVELETSKAIGDLRERGFSLVLDDFGADHSSIANIHRFDFDKIKIDPSLVAQSGKSERAGALVSLICAFGSAFGIKTVAEGIETPQQAENMRQRGCDLAQGFFYDHPLSAEMVRDLIREESTGDDVRWETIRLKLTRHAA